MKKNQPFVPFDKLVDRIKPFIGLSFAEVSNSQGVPFGNPNSKWCIGLFVQDLVGLKQGPSRLDYPGDGDLKSLSHHIREALGACVVGSISSLASQMIDDDVPFDDCVLADKIGKTVLVTVGTNRSKGGPTGTGWEKFTFETVGLHDVRRLPQWGKVTEDWEYLKEYCRNATRTGGHVSSGKKGPNDYLCFNPMAGSFTYGGRNLRRNGGLQLALGATLVNELVA